MVQLLVEAGADTTSPIRITDKAGVLQSFGTPLAYTNQRLRGKKVGGKAATEEQLHTLQAVRRVLMRVEAVHAVSWLWHKHAPSIARAAAITRRATKTTPASSTQMTVMLRILRRRRRRVQRGVRCWHLCSGGRLYLFCFRIRAKYECTWCLFGKGYRRATLSLMEYVVYVDPKACLRYVVWQNVPRRLNAHHVRRHVQ